MTVEHDEALDSLVYGHSKAMHALVALYVRVDKAESRVKELEAQVAVLDNEKADANVARDFALLRVKELEGENERLLERLAFVEQSR